MSLGLWWRVCRPGQLSFRVGSSRLSVLTLAPRPEGLFLAGGVRAHECVGGRGDLFRSADGDGAGVE